MEKNKLQEYATRVTQANRSELVVIIFEATLDSIEEGKKCLEKEDIGQARIEIERAKGFIEELMRSLDMKYEISFYLRQLYIYAYQEICQGLARRDADLFKHSTDILEALLESFKKVANQDDSQPLMGNSQQIYAGLTYGRNSLNETVIR